MGIFQNMVKLLHLNRLQSKLALFAVESVLGSKTHNNFFPVNGRKNGNTDIVFRPVHNLRNSAVLRFSLLRDIHAADNFDTRHHRRQDAHIISALFVERTVDTISYPHFFLKRLNMNIRSTLPCRFFYHFLYQNNDGGIVDVFAERVLFFYNQALFGIILQRGSHFCLSVKTVYCQHDIAGRGYQRLHLTTRDNGNIIHCIQIQRVCHGNSQNVHVIRCILYGNHSVFLKYRRRYQIQYVF